MRWGSFVLCAALALAMPALAADPVQLTIRDGRVTLVATNTTVRQILVEWARVGHTRIVNGERVPGGLVTLQLTNVPEEEALDLVLRAAAGYIAASRAPGYSDGSRFDRILILPTSAMQPASVTPAPTSPPAPFQRPVAPPMFAPSGAEHIIGPDGQPLPDDQAEPDAPQPYVPMPPGFTEPPPQQEPRSPMQHPAPPKVPGGVQVPGMIAPPPAQPDPPREVQPIGPQPQ